MLLDDNCIRLDKIPDSHPSGFPFVCQAEMSRRANIRADRTSLYLLSLPRETHGRASGITGLLADGSSAGVSYIGSNCLHIWWTMAVERRARHYRHLFQHRSPVISAHERAWNSICWNQYFRREYQDSFTQTTVRAWIYIYTTMYFLYNSFKFITRKSNTHSDAT